MKIAVIGRTEMLYDAANAAVASGHQIVLVATAKASPESTVGVSDFETLAAEHGAPFLVRGRFRDDDIPLLRQVRADCAITMNWPTMIREDVVACFPRGIINAHGSDLPEFRGNACPNWAILSGSSRIGLSFHFIDPFGLDTGDVIKRSFIANADDLYIGDVYRWLGEAIPSGFVESIARLDEPGFTAERQDESRASRAYPRRPADGRLAFDRGAEYLHRLVRASSRPFAGAFCSYEGHEVVRVWRASRLISNMRTMAVPGQILNFDDGRPVVACGDDHALRFDEYETASGAPLPRSVRARFF